MILTLMTLIKKWWNSFSTTQKILCICTAVFVIGLILTVLFMTLDYWLPPVLLLLIILFLFFEKIENKNQLQILKLNNSLAESEEIVLDFIQWFFCKSQRDLLGVKAVPLTSSIAYLKKHIKSSLTDDGLIYTSYIGLESFNTQQFYLLWESLTDPINEALSEYCFNHHLYCNNNLQRFQVISTDISDGAIRPSIVIKIKDLNF